ncbi:hypothetical protein FNV43_RR04784 [Rhamnella rubrinervis]|uniref:Uncharacterized protein n=1 Tax=Rhamnella rubrinervis TaxID=2594499 RepID=A0A8K0HK86_9ROSA|nr:hypothetical protein FNV43_RR04784 [Rhamnella rubrinervis]
MASSTSLALVAMVLVVLLPISAMGDVPTWVAEKICEEMECGKGTCKVDNSSSVGFICECDANWKRLKDDDDNDDFRFLPCVIPKCTLNYDKCQPAPPPVPEKEAPHNISAFDPCYWAYCGEGICTRKSNTSHVRVCQCNPGYFNLLNVSVYPCYSECTIGSDCSKLGIKVADATSTDGSQATSFLPGKWMIILMTSVGLMLWK